MLKAEILSTGEEIRSGELIDKNSAWIAEKLEEEGIYVIYHHCVGDDLERMASILQEIGQQADIAVITGGLGPTEDDLTTQAAAMATNSSLVLNTEALENIKKILSKLGLELSESNKKQAMIPENSEIIPNSFGTAPGFHLKIGRCICFFLPGVPYEMQHMFQKSVLPKINILKGESEIKKEVKTFSTFGLIESEASEKLQKLQKHLPEIKIGFRSNFPELHIKLISYGKDASHSDPQLLQATKWVRENFKDKIFSEENESMPTVVGRYLHKQKATLSIAESCTGGLLGHLITSVAGSSNYFLFSGITYDNAAKIKILRVSSETIRYFGAVHEETAKEMAVGVKSLTGSTYAISTTGIAGPGGGNQEKPVGTVCIGLATPEKLAAHRFQFHFEQRSANKKIFSMTALDLLRKELSSAIE